MSGVGVIVVELDVVDCVVELDIVGGFCVGEQEQPANRPVQIHLPSTDLPLQMGELQDVM
jgi:hypothetical protein